MLERTRTAPETREPRARLATDPAPSADRLEQLERIAWRMDKAVKLPIVGVRVGWDSILGLVPGIGDALALAPAVYIVNAARDMGVPNGTLAKMGVNIGIDTIIGSVPLLGDLFDIGWKANTRNVELLRRHVERHSTPRPDNAPPRDASW